MIKKNYPDGIKATSELDKLVCEYHMVASCPDIIKYFHFVLTQFCTAFVQLLKWMQ